MCIRDSLCGGTAYTMDLKSIAEKHMGSNPIIDTMQDKIKLNNEGAMLK